MKAFKIRDNNTGKFKNKGRYGQWTETGFTWTRRQDAVASLNLLRHWDAETRTYVKPNYDRFQVVEYDLVEVK